MAVLDRPIGSGFSLWVSEPLPKDFAQWHKLDSGPDRNALERQAKSLAALMKQRRFAIVEGQAQPPWAPKL
jgi:hypothetical protein